ncbi:MAG: glyoxylate/hydroxypyruvate reductase A [Pseudomonadota bacterium]
MTLNILFAAREDRWVEYEAHLRAALEAAKIDASLATSIPAEEVDYIIYAPNSFFQDFTPYTRTKAVLNLWAGVESIVVNKTLTQPLVRMVDPGMTQSMTEWVVAHVLRYHLGIDAYIVNPDQAWAPAVPPLAEERTVCMLGLGALGASVGQTLAQLGFFVTGWSRSPKTIENIQTFSGENGLMAALQTAEIVVLLLPDTADTANTLNAKSLDAMPRGAFVINPGRGPLINDADLIAALDSGQLAHATLDVFRAEPLPKEHPFWSHPKVTVTPHVAAETRARTAARVIVENIRRGEAGEAFLNVVDRTRGY